MNPMTCNDLAAMYNVSLSTMRTLLGRSEFTKYYVGKVPGFALGKSVRSTAGCWDCNDSFDSIMKKHASRIAKYAKHKVG